MTGALPESPPPARVTRLLDRAAALVAARDRLAVARDAIGSSPTRSPVLTALHDALVAETRGLDEQLCGLYRLVELAEDTWDDLDGPDPLPEPERERADGRMLTAVAHALDDLGRLAGLTTSDAPVDTRAELDSWAALDPNGVDDRLGSLPTASRRLLALADPDTVGTTYGVPWPVRAFANAVAVRRVLHREQLAGTPWSPRIGRLETMLRRTPDPTGRAPGPVRRVFVAFSPHRTGRMTELVGRIDAGTRAVAVYVPGTGTNLDMSHVNTDVAVDLVRTGGPALAAVAFLDGEFPQDLLSEAGQMRYAEHMAPRLVRFCREVDRVTGLVCPGAALTVLGHSYGGRIVGTAERRGLRADRLVYAESPDAGVGVDGPSDWRNPSPALRFSMTAPGDPIELLQMRFGLRRAYSHSDLGGGVVRLDTGFFADGTPVYGPRGHGGVFDPGSDPLRAMVAVALGGPVAAWRDRGIRSRHTSAPPGSDGRLLPALRRLALGQWLRRDDDPYADAEVTWAGPSRVLTVPRPGPM